MDDSTRSVDEKKKLLKLACDRHQMLYRNAMNGQGIDRHMFGLYVVSKGLGYVSLIKLSLFHVLECFIIVCKE